MHSIDGADEKAVGGAGDEIADALIAGEQRHGVAIGLGAGKGGKDLSFTAGPGGTMSARIGVAAMGDGEVGGGGRLRRGGDG
jgi:hypothetical protein